MPGSTELRAPATRGAEWQRRLQQSRLGPTLRELRADRLDTALARALRRRKSSRLAAQVLYRGLVGRAPHRHEVQQLRERARAGVPFTQLVTDLEQTAAARDWLTDLGVEALRGTLNDRLADSTPTQPRLVFLHIMKVGGSSLSDLVRHLVPPERVRMHVFLDDLVLLPPQLLAQMRLIGGHIPFEALDLIPGAFSTLTVLRDPYTRTLSHYRHLREVRPEYADLTLERFVFDDRFSALSHNYQARQLAHEINLSRAWYTYSPIQLGIAPSEPYPLQSLFDSGPVALTDGELFHRAEQNLAKVDHVGVTEHLDETAAAISRQFGAQPRPLAHLNASRPIDPRDIDARIRRRIDERTGVDRRLYELAADRAGDFG
jgi:hypothetical protein